MAHQLLRDPAQWVQDGKLVGTIVFGNPSEILAREVETWSGLWCGSKEGGEASLSDARIPMPLPVPPQEIARISKSFKRKTCAIDRCHPRHFALLSKAGPANALAFVLAYGSSWEGPNAVAVFDSGNGGKA